VVIPSSSSSITHPDRRLSAEDPLPGCGL